MNNFEVLQAFGIIITFLLFVVLMMTRKMTTILALPIMAIIFSVIAGIPFISKNAETFTISASVLSLGSMKLSSAISGLIFGSIFGQILNKVGITKGIIRKAAELAGDKPLLISLVFFFAGSIIISASGGLGMVILIGTIMIPIMLTTGISPMTSTFVILLSVAVGALFNVSNWAVYTDVLGLKVTTIAEYSWISAVPVIVMGIIMIIFFVNKDIKNKKNWTSKKGTDVGESQIKVPTIALISPIIPVLLVFIFKLDIVSAVLCGIAITLILVRPKRPLHIISSCFVEGIQEVAGAIALMIGIGMLLAAVTSPAISAIVSPFMEKIIPTSFIGYILFFTLLSPLAIYRGPLNVFGLGSGVAALLVSAGLNPIAAMIALRNVTNIQSVCDPTNSHNVWLADFTKTDVNEILRQSIFWMMACVLVSMVIGAVVIY